MADGVDPMSDTASRHFETARLRMRPIEAGDFDDLARLPGDPEIMAGKRLGGESRDPVWDARACQSAAW